MQFRRTAVAIERLRRFLVKLALGLGVLAAITVGAELYLRWFRPVSFRRPMSGALHAGVDWSHAVHVQGTRPGIAYELAPHLDLDVRGIHVHTNSLGMRCDEPLPRSTPGLKRVAVVGDSMTFGFDLQQGEDLPAQLQRELRARVGAPAVIEVLNCGISGYSTRDEVEFLREKVLPLEPDAIVLQYCLNDPEITPMQPLPAAFHDVEWWQHSELLRFCASRLHGRVVREFGGGDYWKALHNPKGPFWGDEARALDEFAELCRSRHLPTFALVLPMLTADPFDAPVTHYTYADVHRFVDGELQRRGFDVFDTAPLLCALAPRDVIAARDDMHLNVSATRMVAEKLAERLAPKLGAP